jgi:hypothetical protein
MKAVVVCIPLFLMLTFRSDASPAAGTDNQVKLLMRRYEQVEDQLARSVHYVRKTESDGGTTIEQAWFNGAHDLIIGRGRADRFVGTRVNGLCSAPLFWRRAHVHSGAQGNAVT